MFKCLKTQVAGAELLLTPWAFVKQCSCGILADGRELVGFRILTSERDSPKLQLNPSTMAWVLFRDHLKWTNAYIL